MSFLLRSDNYFRRTGGGGLVSCPQTGFYRPETVWHEKVVLKIKSIVMRTTNNLFRKVHNYAHFKG